jgi:hypothetical protein
MNISTILYASLLASAAFALTANGASAATCLASVGYKDSAGNTGVSPLGTKTVTSPSDCHQFARTAFAASQPWSPYGVCSNTKLKTPITVWVLDQFQGGGSLYNRVIAYTVDCTLAGDVAAHP